MSIALHIGPAVPGDRDTVRDLLHDASRWERARGIEDPWPMPFPTEVLEAGIARREVFLARAEDGRPIATFSLQDEDPAFWGSQNPPAIYLHRFTVRRDFAGQGLGARLLAWAEEEGRRRGARFLRLDCLATNRGICSYYERLGFEPVGRVQVRGFPCARYQRPIRGGGSHAPPRARSR